MNRTSESLPPADFYDALAEGYDAMTGFVQRTARAERFVLDLLERHGGAARAAADVGCGTGAYTLALARAGFDALGLDPSPEMIHQARRNAERLNQEVRFVQAGLAEVAGETNQPLDLVVCMGNTVPHILDPADLRDGFAAAAEALRKGGALAVQTLNYDRILAERERIVSIDTEGSESFVRFYDFLPEGLVRFNLLHFSHAGGEHRLTSVLLRPYVQTELGALLDQSGFRHVAAYGSLDFAPFDPATSETLLLVAEC